MTKKRPRGPRASEITETDLASRKMGDNAIMGDDQDAVRNERHAVPDVRQSADRSITETLEKSDKDVWASRDLGKGRRSGRSNE